MTKERKIHITYNAVLVILFLGCVIIHFYRITEIPFGVHVDEMGMAYDAWCLSHYGVDRYLSSYPVYLNNFGGGQSALYAYLCSFVLKFCDISVFAIRLPIILTFLFSIVLGLKTIKLIGHEVRIKTLLYMIFVTILPVYIMLFRIGIDCNLMLVMMEVFVYFMFRAIYNRRNWDFVVAGIFCGLVLYTYVIAHVAILVFLLFIIPYLLFTKRIKPLQLLYFGIPLGFIAAPLIMMQIINLLNLKEIKLGLFTITKLFLYRSEDIGADYFSFENIWRCLKNIFLYGYRRWDAVPEFGTIYYVSIPFVVIGLVKSICISIKLLIHKEFYHGNIYVIWFFTMCFCGSIMEPFTYRLNGVYVSVIYFLVEGVLTVCTIFKYKKTSYAAGLLVILVYMLLFSNFLKFYFGGSYEEKYVPMGLCDYPLNETIDYVEGNEEYENKTIYIGHLGQTYIYFLGAKMLSPYEYHAENPLNKEDSFSRAAWTVSYKNYIFSLPERIDYNGIYIVNKLAETEEGYRERLERAGFRREEIGKYGIYIFDIENFDCVENEYYIQWNAGVSEEGAILADTATMQIEETEYVVLVGWSYNTQDNRIWDSVYLVDENENYYTSDIVERVDVVEKTGSEELRQSGMLFIIPKEAIQDVSNLQLVGIDSLNQKYMQVQMAIIEE